MMKTFLRNIPYALLVPLFLPVDVAASSHPAFRSRNRYETASSPQWTVGAAIALLGGAGLGYTVAKENQGKSKGSPSSPVVYNTTDSWVFSADNAITSGDLLASISIFDPTGAFVTGNIFIQGTEFSFTIPDGAQKLEGEYQLLLSIVGDSVTETAIGTFFLNGKPFSLVEGPDPALVQQWVPPEIPLRFTSLLRVAYP